MTPNLNHKPNLKLSIDKILFIIACTYLTLVIFWLVSQGKLKLPGMGNSSEQGTKQATNQQQTLSPQDAQFIAYLQQSLELIERKQQQQKANAKTAKSKPTQTLKVPPAPLPTNPPSTTATAPRIIEKIYIPVYPPQQPSVAVNPPIKANTNVPVIAVKPPSPTQKKVPPPPPLPAPPQPSTQPLKTPSTVPVLTPGVALVPQAASPTSSNNGNLTFLVGLLEAGDQSSALFTLDGKTRRVQLGEAIGTTGWILQSVQNQQVIITRNGKARSLEVGQNF